MNRCSIFNGFIQVCKCINSRINISTLWFNGISTHLSKLYIIVYFGAIPLVTKTTIIRVIFILQEKLLVEELNIFSDETGCLEP